MSLLSLLAGGLPTPQFDTAATGTARLCADVAAGVVAETDVEISWAVHEGAPPALVFTLPTGERVEANAAELLAFVNATTHLDVLELFGQVGALLG